MSPSLIAYCTFMRPPTWSARASAVVCASSARMDAGLLDVLHDAGDEHVFAVAERVDVDLDRVREVAVEEERVLAEHRVDLAGLVVRIARLDVGGDEARQGAEEVVLE